MSSLAYGVSRFSPIQLVPPQLLNHRKFDLRRVPCFQEAPKAVVDAVI